MSHADRPQDLAAVRQRLDAVRGKDYWRSLEELAQTDEFLEVLREEMPRYAGGWVEGIDRRKFLGLIGASLALAGLSGCTQAPREKIMPYVRQPEEITPGVPMYFATAMPLAGYGSGVLVKSYMGRPIKIEGNPDHPGSPRPVDSPEHSRFGPTDVFAQASLLSLYDPDRSQAVRYRGEISSWETFRSGLEEAFRDDLGHDRVSRLRLRVLTETVTSPTLAQQIRAVLRRFPRARWHQYEPAGRDSARAGARQAFGQEVETLCRFDQAAVVLALDADFLACGPGHVRYARDFSARRRVRHAEGEPAMNRLYAVESTPTLTGAMADHRVALRAGQVESFARAVAARVGMAGPAPDEAALGLRPGWIAALAADLQLPANRGRSIVVAGDGQPPVVHALTHALNERLGNVGRTVVHVAPVEAEPTDHTESLRHLVTEMDAGTVDVLLILGGNPVYTAPADFRFEERLQRVPLRIHLSPYFDETSQQCHWHIPEAHYLESWGDVRAYDGTVSVIQPLIAPLYGGHSAVEVLSGLTGQSEGTDYELVRAYWRQFFGTGRLEGQAVVSYTRLTEELAPFRGDFEAWWRSVLHDGLIRGTESPVRRVTAREAIPPAAAPAGQGLEIVFRADSPLFDGRFANNGWLQELPRPISKITWDNVVFLSAATAVSLGFAPSLERAHEANGKRARLGYPGMGDTLLAPLWVLPGHANNTVTVSLGYGRTAAGHVGNGVGFNAYKLRTAAAPWIAQGVSLEPTGERYPLATTQHHHLLDPEHNPVHSADVHRYHELTDPAHREQPPRISLYPDYDYSRGNQWGMSIDLTLCTGCSACVVACQSENNIPVVGKDQVARGRAMHWLRIDSYYKGEPTVPAELRTYFQPLACVHCENAPCELVCPVEATSHSRDGLNEMAYNRCVGTRYCLNNCPYKVRRFNYLQFQDFNTESLRLMRNPEVTVRSRGVMEKCTYCVQRLRNGQITAQREDRDLLDGEVVTACQAACPAGAIIFGDLNDRGSKVRRLQDDPISYGLLDELNTRPRTKYLTALKNPNPAILTLEGRPQHERG